MERRKKYKLSGDKRKTYNKTVVITLNEELLEKIDEFRKKANLEEYSNSSVLREIISLGLKAFNNGLVLDKDLEIFNENERDGISEKIEELFIETKKVLLTEIQNVWKDKRK